MIRMLHYVQDEKFSPIVIPHFEMRTDIQSQYIYYHRHPNKPLRYLQGFKQVRIIENREKVIAELRSDDYDVLYLHSIYISFWPLLKYIPTSKIIIWWMWGYEIYLPSPYGQKHSFLEFDTLLPLTKIVLDKSVSKSRRLFLFLRGIAIDLFWPFFRNQIIRRIDYFKPVIHIEFEMMSKLKGFHAKEFYLPRPDLSIQMNINIPVLSGGGSIQIGNSASFFCNHLDVWNQIKRYIPIDCKVVLPLSYGDNNYAGIIKEAIKRDHENLESIDGFLPRDEYFSIVNKCSYYVHGAIRQHGMGNIYNALVSGRKVFLFKKSLMYKHLIDNGYVVFTIEDVNEDSFRTPLSIEDSRNNIDAHKREIEIRNEVGTRVLEEINNAVKQS